MSVVFKTNIQWPIRVNELLLPPEYYGVTVPSGLDSFYARVPEFVDVPGIEAALRGSAVRGSTGGGLGIVNGLVTRELEVRFDNPAAQWQLVYQGQRPTRGPATFQFRGGTVNINLKLGIYVLNINEPKPSDPISVQIFATVYEHELLHVLDDIDIVNNWLPPRLNPEQTTISRYLVQAQPFTYGTQGQTIDQIEREFRNYIQERVQSTIRNDIWAPETNRRGSARDAPGEYRIVQERIDTLRARQINRK
jgi:hypothetical protein